jgi:hypothetical protein
MTCAEKSIVAPRIVFAAACLAVLATTFGALGNQSTETDLSNDTHPYVGLWVTDDGRVRHELLPNGRYDEARGSRESAYQGQYWVDGTHIDYLDDTGFRADGEFIDGVLHHGGMILRRQ